MSTHAVIKIQKNLFASRAHQNDQKIMEKIVCADIECFFSLQI